MATKNNSTEDAKNCFIEVRTFYDKLTKTYGSVNVKWAFNRKLNWEREKAKLEKKKKDLEAQLQKITEELR